MAEKEKAKVEKAEKKPKKIKPYKKKRTCPKCGSGTHLAEHPNRASCGKCGYSEIKTGDKG